MIAMVAAEAEDVMQRHNKKATMVTEVEDVVAQAGEVEVVAVMVLTSTIHINKEFSIAINLAILHRTAPFDG